MLDGKAHGCSQWFLFLRSIGSGVEKPLLAGLLSSGSDALYYFETKFQDSQKKHSDPPNK